VTDGGFRDSPDIAQMAIPAYHSRPSAPTNLTLHQAIDMNLPIACGDVAVFPGDVVVGDAEGVPEPVPVPLSEPLLLGVLDAEAPAVRLAVGDAETVEEREGEWVPFLKLGDPATPGVMEFKYRSLGADPSMDAVRAVREEW
jgi:hypothetical protein